MKIVCFGDSNTYGYDPRSYFGGRYAAENRWTDCLAQKTGWEVINAGENGREIPRRTGEFSRFEAFLKRQQPVDMLLVLLGGNDLLQGASVLETKARMEQFLENISISREKIFLLGPPPMQRGAWVESDALVRSSMELSACYETLAKELRIAFINTVNWDISLTFDGVHFSEEGNHRFAERLAEELKKFQ